MYRVRSGDVAGISPSISQTLMTSLRCVGEWPKDGLETLPACPVCGADKQRVELTALTDTTFGTAPGTWTLNRCDTCSTGYLNPRPTRGSIAIAYSKYYTHADKCAPRGIVANARRAMANSYRNHIFGSKLVPSFPAAWILVACARKTASALRMNGRSLDLSKGRPGRVLDIGCGGGDFLAFARHIGWQAFGVEMDKLAASNAIAKGVHILAPTTEDIPDEYANCFDLITLNHVIEHLHDPIAVLRRCHLLLKPNGKIWIETPNISSVGYEFYGAFWRGLECPRHLVLFNAQSLITALEKTGFTYIELLPPRDVTHGIFSLSEKARSGNTAEDPRVTLSSESLRAIAASVSEARKKVDLDRKRSEFLNITAVKSARTGN